MDRPAARSHGVTFVAIAVACTLILSVIGSTGYVLLCGNSGRSLTVPTLFESEPPETAAEEQTDTGGTILHAIDMAALCDTFAPEFLLMGCGGKVFPISVHLKRSAFQTGIYRPPIV